MIIDACVRTVMFIIRIQKSAPVITIKKRILWYKNQTNSFSVFLFCYFRVVIPVVLYSFVNRTVVGLFLASHRTVQQPQLAMLRVFMLKFLLMPNGSNRISNKTQFVYKRQVFFFRFVFFIIEHFLFEK